MVAMTDERLQQQIVWWALQLRGKKEACDFHKALGELLKAADALWRHRV